MHTISEISETWVPPQGQPAVSPILTMRGVLSCQSGCINIKTHGMLVPQKDTQQNVPDLIVVFDI